MMDNNVNLDKQPNFNANMYQSPEYNPNNGTKSSNKKVIAIVLVIVGIVVLLIAALIVGIFTFVFSLLKEEEYDLSGGTIASYYAITDTMPNQVSSSYDINKKTIINEIQYNRNDETMYDDIEQYITYLDETGFLCLEDIEPGSTSGTIDMAMESSAEGEIIRVTIDYKPGYVKVIAMQYEDELTVY